MCSFLRFCSTGRYYFPNKNEFSRNIIYDRILLKACNQGRPKSEYKRQFDLICPLRKLGLDRLSNSRPSYILLIRTFLTAPLFPLLQLNHSELFNGEV